MKRCTADILLAVIMIMLVSGYAGFDISPASATALATELPGDGANFSALAYTPSPSTATAMASTPEVAGGKTNSAVSFVKVNGRRISFPDGQPFIENGRTLVPVRFIAEALGYEVDWIQESKTVTINNGQILLPIGSKTATVNGKQVTIDVPAKLVVTNGMTRTYVPLRFVSESLNCTVDWFNANRSVIINSLLPDGKEVSLYDRCYQSELFYEKIDKNNPRWDSELYLKSSLRALNDDACLDAEWLIARYFTRYPTYNIRENGSDIYILIYEPTLKTRREVKDLLMTFYPTGYEEVYDILMKTIREEIFENNGLMPSTISGTFGYRYIDNREVHINKLFSTLNIQIQVKDAGYINPEKPSLFSEEALKYKISNGVAHHYAGKWYMEKYELDKW